MATSYLSPMPYYPHYFIPTPGPTLANLDPPISHSPRATKLNTPSPSASPYSLPVYPNVVFASPSPYIAPYIVPAPFTPAPVYTGLSPLFSEPEEPQEPEDVFMDKWEAAGTGYLYDNRHSPVSLNSVHSTLDVNPILAHGTMPLIVDLSRGFNEISASEIPGQSLWFKDLQDVLSQPATIPRVTKLRLLSPKTKYTIELAVRTGVTVSTKLTRSSPLLANLSRHVLKVGHVLDSLIQCFHTNLDPGTEGFTSGDDERRRTLAYFANARYRPYGLAPPFLRRVDLLYGEPIFDGLSADSEATYERSGERDCSILLMHFRTRSESWSW